MGGIISNNQLVNAIFNENFTTTEGEPKRLIVNGTLNKPKFIIYSLDVENQISLSSCRRNAPTQGTILEIKVDSINPSDIFRYYFRIRLQVEKRDISFINNDISGVSVLSNQFTNTEVIDFRLNDIRSCSDELREQFDKGNKFQLLAVHYLILRNANDAIINYGKDINSRVLENDLWKNYIDGTNHNIIAYHIKSKAKGHFDPKTNGYTITNFVEDFSDLTRFQYQKETTLVVIFYIIVIIVLGGIGGVLGNWLSTFLGL